MLPFPVICFFLPKISVIIENGFKKLSGVKPGKEEEEPSKAMDMANNPTMQKMSFFRSLIVLFYVLLILGTSFFTFTVGGLLFWGPDYFVLSLELDLAYVTLAFGILAVFSGILGAGFGGMMIDKMGGVDEKFGPSKALFLAVGLATVAIPLGLGAFIYSESAVPTFVMMALAMFFLFGIYAPVTGALFKIVSSDDPTETDLRPFAFSINVFITHLLGDFPSPILIGVVQDLGFTRTWAMIATQIWCVGGVLFWGLSGILCFFHSKKHWKDVGYEELEESDDEKFFETQNSSSSEVDIIGYSVDYDQSSSSQKIFSKEEILDLMKDSEDFPVEIPSIHQVLSNEVWREWLRMVGSIQFSEENVLFCVEVLNLEKCVEIEEKALVCSELFSKYVDKEAPLLINIGGERRKKITEKIGAADDSESLAKLSETVYDSAFNEILKLMQYGIYQTLKEMMEEVK